MLLRPYSHSILFDRFEQELGITGTALEWIKSYFSNRTTSISINGFQSAKSHLRYGLPQGSIMGPLSFSIYTIPIGRIIQKHGLLYHFYADDIQLYIQFDPSCKESTECALSKLSSCIQEIQSWMTTNILKLNCHKTEFVVALSRHNERHMPNVQLQIGNDAVKPSKTVVLQNWACKVIFQASKYDHASPLLRQLHWFPLKSAFYSKLWFMYTRVSS